jgi:cobalt-zinc-cadmium efflux system outer membrane protein
MTAGTLGNPVVQYQAENTRFPGGAPVSGMSPEQMTTATFPLSPLYQRGARVRQANASVRAAEADAQATGQLLALDAARSFYRTALAQVSANASQNLAAWLDSLVAYNATRVQQGVAAEADLIRSQLERDRALADAGMDAAELARARAELSAYLADGGIAARSLAVDLSDLPLGMPAAPVTTTSVPSAALDQPATSGLGLADRALIALFDTTVVSRRPSLRAARERAAAALAGTAIEQRMLLRDVGALLGVKQTAGTTSMVTGFTLPLPLIDFNRGPTARARAERDAAEFELRAQTRVARAEWIGAREAAEILSTRVGSLAARDSAGAVAYLARADAGRMIALGAYREGAVSLLQVLDAARAWAEARVTYYRTLYAQHEAVLALLVAQGDDLSAVLPTVTPVSR